MQWVERDLVIHASSPDALRILSKLKNKDKEMAFENPNCPEDVLQKRATEQYKKIKAKMKYADKLEIPYVIVIGDNEIETGKIKVKNIFTFLI